MVAVNFPDAPFYKVADNSMPEISFGNADEYLGWRFCVRCGKLVYHLKRINGKATPFFEQRIYLCFATQAFAFGEPGHIELYQ